MISLLAPGGWLVVEELDSMAVASDPDPERRAIFSAYKEALSTIDFECGRALLSELGEAGLAETAADVRVDAVEGASALARWEQLSVQALIDEVLSAETATLEQIDRHIARLEDPAYRGFGFAWVGARAPHQRLRARSRRVRPRRRMTARRRGAHRGSRQRSW
jgi:hypothetical protein